MTGLQRQRLITIGATVPLVDAAGEREREVIPLPPTRDLLRYVIHQASLRAGIPRALQPGPTHDSPS
jgi:hypothetical protein